MLASSSSCAEVIRKGQILQPCARMEVFLRTARRVGDHNKRAKKREGELFIPRLSVLGKKEMAVLTDRLQR